MSSARIAIRTEHEASPRAHRGQREKWRYGEAVKPHPKIRKALKWAGLAACLGLAAVWIISGWWRMAWYSHGRLAFCMDRGLLQVHWFDSLRDPWPATERIGWVIPEPAAGGMHSFHRYGSYTLHRAGSCVAFPVWLSGLPIGGATTAAWVFDAIARRRIRMNGCPACGYDLTGIPCGQPCPECGSGAPMPPS